MSQQQLLIGIWSKRKQQDIATLCSRNARGDPHGGVNAASLPVSGYPDILVVIVVLIGNTFLEAGATTKAGAQKQKSEQRPKHWVHNVRWEQHHKCQHIKAQDLHQSAQWYPTCMQQHGLLRLLLYRSPDRPNQLPLRVDH